MPRDSAVEFSPGIDAFTSAAVAVFISSTFRDMQQERDVLVKQTFPALRQHYASAGIVVSDVDLRWGVTSEQVAEGALLSVCFAEIDRCRPHFIAILGERYGAASRIPPGTLSGAPWVSEHVGASVTELEIRHALRTAETRDRAIFYLRSPADVAGVISERHHEHASESPEAQERLRRLKQFVRESGCRVRVYEQPQGLGSLVHEDLRRSIDAMLAHRVADAGKPGERVAHEAYAGHFTHVFVEPRDAFLQLERHVDGDGPPLAISGDPGCGKTALVANWLAWRRRRTSVGEARTAGWWHRLRGAPEPIDCATWAHFVGATPTSSDWKSIVRRLLLETLPDQRRDDWTDDNLLRHGIAHALATLARSERVLFVLDGLDQLDAEAQARELEWLPRVFPPGVRVVLTCNAGETLDRLTERNWPQLPLPRLEPPARAQIAEAALLHSGKRLESDLMSSIQQDEECGSPRYLRTVIDELRIGAAFESLPRDVARLAAAASYEELLLQLLDRVERDVDGRAPGRAGRLLSFLASARWGLTEHELLLAAGTGGSQLPMASWAPLRVALDDRLLTRAGVIAFREPALRNAIVVHHLADPARRLEIHTQLAALFWASSIERQVQELPWHLKQTDAWPALARKLAEPAFLEHSWRESPFELQQTWNATGAHVDVLAIAQDALRDGRALARPAGRIVALLMRRAGAGPAALEVVDRVIAALEHEGDERSLAPILGDRAAIAMDLGRLDEASTTLSRQERLSRRLDDQESLRSCLTQHAALAAAVGRPDEALRQLDELEPLCRRAQDDGGLASVLMQRAALVASNHPEEALAHLVMAERLWRGLGDDRGLAASLGAQATIVRQQHDLSRAIDLHRREEAICRRLHDPPLIASSLVNQAMILMQQLDFDGALRLLSEAEGLCRRSGHMAPLVRTLTSRAGVFYNLGLGAQAQECIDEAVLLASRHGLRALESEAGALQSQIRLWRDAAPR